MNELDLFAIDSPKKKKKTFVKGITKAFVTVVLFCLKHDTIIDFISRCFWVFTFTYFLIDYLQTFKNIN